MAEAIKWGILVVAIVSLILTVLALPVVQGLDFELLSDSIDVIITYAGGFLYNARGLVNMFLFESARGILTGLILYLFISWACKLSVKIGAWIIHFIFK